MKSDDEQRVKSFTDAYEKLCLQYQCRLMAAPQLAPSGERGFNLIGVLVPVDMKERGILSPLNKEDILK